MKSEGEPAKVTAVAFYLCMFGDHSMRTTEPVTSSLSQYALRMAFRKSVLIVRNSVYQLLPCL